MHAGSSPLARGLLGRGRSGEGAGRPGIIPARAGFTRPLEALTRSSQDHPRSRRVYSRPLRALISIQGSSPLARGLLGATREGQKVVRIIPARAGFTDVSPDLMIESADHPRSRGVYLVKTILCTTKSRIIPARAGFTHNRITCANAVQDHPRSRGVYALRALRLSGLHRIIPARAGFTGSGTPSRGRPSDHPRSRGVYDGHSLLVNFGHGIIPARAGFTGFRSSFFTVLWDHPRSRGVYSSRTAPPLAGLGSSPLARGLREQDRAPDAEAGIIPARAGFTSQSGARADWTPDHPRSRGVYGRIDAARHRLPGSSPLARGLPHRLTHV